MADYRTFNCPSCGAKAEVNRVIAMGTCEYCRGAFYFKDEAVTAYGEMNVLAEPDSVLYVGATGRLKGRRFNVMGRVRYRYEEGLWDEWYLQDETFQPLWIGEDEGELSLEVPVEIKAGVPAYEEVEPGLMLNLTCGDGTVLSVSVDEMDTAVLEGIEGHLPQTLLAERQFPYVDASQGELTVTLEYGDDGADVYRGEWIGPDDLELDQPRMVWADA